MSLDKLQEKIRKSKNPSVIELSISEEQLPPHLLAEEGSFQDAYERFCRELLTGLRGIVPAVRFSYSFFAMLERLSLLTQLCEHAVAMGYYVIVDAPESLSLAMAEMTAEKILSLPCDGALVSAYIGSDGLKPYVKRLKDRDKALFAVIRSANRSASEIQDLMTGSRLVHMAVADTVNRLGEPLGTRCGYNRVAGVAAATSAQSIRSLRSQYKNVFLLLDGYDYTNANAKNCSYAFDRLGHGGAACAGSSVTAAWQQAYSQGEDYVAEAAEAAERMKKNLTRYITVL